MSSVFVIVAASAPPFVGSSTPAALERFCGRRLLDAALALVIDAVDAEAVIVAAGAGVSVAAGTAVHQTMTTDLSALLCEGFAIRTSAGVGVSIDPLYPLLTAETVRSLVMSARAGRAAAVGTSSAELAALAAPMPAPSVDPALLPVPNGQLARVVSRKTLVDLEREAYLERASALLAAGLLIRDPATTRIEGPVSFGVDVEIEPGCTLRGPVTLGDRVRVGANSILARATVGDDTEIRPFTIVEDSAIAERCFVGPYARVRPGTLVGPQGQIGNFVELKAARLGRRARINHLSFVGDATFADEVTIGAGTITCNHDGVRSQPTTIGAGAYVGSGCVLVAPVTIGEGATVGAGSTITKDAPASKLTLARTRQIVVEGWRGFESKQK